MQLNTFELAILLYYRVNSIQYFYSCEAGMHSYNENKIDRETDRRGSTFPTTRICTSIPQHNYSGDH